MSGTESKLDLSNKVVECLKNHLEERFTARDIAKWIFKEYPEECSNKRERSENIDNDEELITQITAEISAHRPAIQKKDPNIKVTEGRPRKYYYTKLSDSAEIGRVESKTSTSANVSENDLYPMLSEFLLSELKIYSKRIDHNCSSNSRGPGGNRWLHPDLVGLEDLSQDWGSALKTCVQVYGDKKSRLWSFEVKKRINRSNVRESFFQAVSNSSWANFGYLVASEIKDDGTYQELQILASLHGIGVINFDIENLLESQIMIPARERNRIDWDTVNRLLEEKNADFSKYIKLITQFYQTGEVRPKDWDAQGQKE